MRSILTLSLPAGEVPLLKKRAKSRGFASLSEYIRFLIGIDEDLISQEEILAAAGRAEKDYQAGRLKRIASLAEIK